MWRRDAALCLLLLTLCPLVAHADEWGIDVRDAPGGKAAEITAVGVGTPADLASLIAGDLIVQVLGTPIESAEQYRQAIAANGAPGDLTMVVTRNGWAREARLRPAPGMASFGLNVVGASGGAAEVAAVASGGPAALAGLQPGDVITAADGVALDNVATLQRILSDRAGRAQPLVVTVKRAEWSKQTTLTPRIARDGGPNVASRDVRAGAITPMPAPIPPPSASALPVEPVHAPVPAPRVDPAAALPGEATDVVTNIQNGNRTYDAGNWRDAEVYYQRIVRAVPDEPNSWGRLCHAQVMQQKFREAADTCRTATQFAAREASVYQNLGYSLFRLGRHADSIVWYRKASELAPDWALPYSGAGASYYALSDWAKTEESYRLAVARDPQNVAAWQALGDAAAELGRPTDAIVSYRKALSLRAGSAELYRLFGWQLFRAGQLAEAEGAFRESNRLNPKDANTLVILGIVADKLGKYAEAREAWQRAIELEPSTGMGVIARQNMVNLDSRQATGRAAPIAIPSQPPRAAARDDAKPARPAMASDEPRVIVEPETDSGI